MKEKRVKVILLGESSVGKSSIFNQFINADFDPFSLSTVGVDIRRRLFQIKNRDEKGCIELWDTAGQEHFRTFICSHFRSAHRALLVFDITNMASFQQIDYWRKEIERHADLKNNQMILVGNKVDLVEEPRSKVLREVPKEIVEEYTKLHGLVYREVSAKDHESIEKLFSDLIGMTPLSEIQPPNGINLKTTRSLKQRLCCSK